MNKFLFCFVLLLSGNLLLVDAQNYKISGRKGSFEIKRGNNSWYPAKLGEDPLSGNDYLRNIENYIVLTQGKTPKQVFKRTSPVSVHNAWKNGKKWPSINKATPRTKSMGVMPDFYFDFVNNANDTTHVVTQKDSLVSMIIDHASDSTLYAHVYWFFQTDSSYCVMSWYISDPIIELKPGVDNEFFFKPPMPINREENSEVYIFWSTDNKKDPIDGLVPSWKLLVEEMEKRGYKYHTVEIEFNKWQ